MSDRRKEKTIHADQVIELMMRDVLEGMEDFAAQFGYRPWQGVRFAKGRFDPATVPV